MCVHRAWTRVLRVPGVCARRHRGSVGPRYSPGAMSRNGTNRLREVARPTITVTPHTDTSYRVTVSRPQSVPSRCAAASQRCPEAGGEADMPRTSFNRQIEVNLLAQPPLRPDAEAITDEQHPDHQFGIDRWPAEVAIERSQFAPQRTKLDEPTNRAAGKMSGRSVLTNTRAAAPGVPVSIQIG
jgi:hypothetical protein